MQKFTAKKTNKFEPLHSKTQEECETKPSTKEEKVAKQMTDLKTNSMTKN